MNKFEAALKKYLDIFSGEEMYFVTDIRNLELFSRNPKNSTREDVQVKVSALNDVDIRALTLEHDMIDHIHQLNIDDRLQQGDLTLVEDIASLTVKSGASHHFLHFASVYCNYHRPDAFPIYSEQYFDFYRMYINEHNLGIDPDKLNTYAVFCEALKDLAERLQLSGKMNYLHLRKFAWLYADKLLQEDGT